MKRRVLDFLACPECRSASLDLQTFSTEGEEIVDGILRCEGCHRLYPVIAGVPRMLPDELRSSLRIYHPEFFSQHDIPVDDSTGSDGVSRTLEFFTQQRVELFEDEVKTDTWARFEQTLNLRIPAAHSFAGKVGLDAGCGEGRYSYTLNKYGAEIVGMDLGNAVDWAYKRLGSQPKAHIVQGSIFQPPFHDSAFEFVMSIGVIHHMTDPRRGFQALAPLLSPGGEIHIWVYGVENMSRVYRASHMRPVRRLTAGLNPKQTYALAVPIALGLEVYVFTPTRVLSHIPALRAHIPHQLLEVSALKLSHKIAEVHDRIGAPVTHFLTKAELDEWFQTAGLTDVAITPTADGRGWSAHGSRPS